MTTPSKIAKEKAEALVQRHMRICGVIGCWEILSDAIAQLLGEAEQHGYETGRAEVEEK